jgi:hypothetical protein
MSEINLLTNEQKLDQKLHVYFKFINVFLVLCFLGVSGITYYYYTLYAPLLEEKNKMETKVLNIKTELVSYSEEELALRDIKNRYDLAMRFKGEKVLFEKIIVDIYQRNISGGVKFKTITFNNDKKIVSIRVSADSTSFMRYFDNIKAVSVAENNIKSLFSPSDVPEEVNEVSKEYVVTVRYNPEKLNVK